MPLYGEPGTQIGYEVYAGPPDAPPILLLHGFAASSAIFGSNLGDLARSFTVVTVDLLGHGESDAPDDVEAYAPEAAAARVIGLMDHLGYDRALLCGHSLGGALALRIALDHPNRVAGIVMINSSSASGTPRWREETQPRLNAIAARIRTEGTWFIRESGLFPARSRRIPEEDRDRLTYDFDHSSSVGFACTAEALVARVNAWERLGELTVPALVIAGERDKDFMHGAPRMVAQMRQNRVQLVTFEDAGHAANLEEPDLFEEAVVGFAQEIDYLEGPPPARKGRTALILVAGSIITILLAAGAAAIILLREGDEPVLGNQPFRTETPTSPTAVVAGGTAQASETASASPSASATPSSSASPSPSGTATATPTPETPTPTPVPPTPTNTTAAVVPTPTPRPPTPTPVPPTATPTNTPEPTATPTPTDTPTPTATPTPAGPDFTIRVTRGSESPLDFGAGVVDIIGGTATSASWSVTGPGTVQYQSEGFSTSGRVSVAGAYTITATVTFSDGTVLSKSTIFQAG